MADQRTNLLGLTREELSGFVERIGEPHYRGRQIFTWLYGKAAPDFRRMTDLGKAFRSTLESTATIRGVTAAGRQVSPRDGTTKFLFGLSDGLQIESVLIPPAASFAPGGESAQEEEQKRLTLCVSTQVGCPLDCAFCATGTMGFLRNLSAGEIIDQVLQVRRITARRITNVVFMGMGEPLLNYEAVMKAADLMVDGIGIAARRITISTAGRPDRIRRMGDQRRRQKLAVSLHSGIDETRARLMPINRKFTLRTLRSALEHYYAMTGQRVTFEIILFDRVNDSDNEVEAILRFARAIPSKINIIPFHSIDVTRPAGFARTLKPSPRTEAIVEYLRAQHLTVMIRSNSGEDIDGACGQLVVRSTQTGSGSRAAEGAEPRPMQRPRAVAAP